MTIYEELYKNYPGLSKFYRFEGVNMSFPYFNAKNGNICIKSSDPYIYFSSSIAHHKYYVSKRLRQLIQNKILSFSEIKLDYKSLICFDTFKEIVRIIETYEMDDEMISYECSTSRIMLELLYKNTIDNRYKSSGDRRVERCDQTKHKGGYGFCEEWLEIFNLLTYFYCYQKITRDNLIDYLYAKREKILNPSLANGPCAFLREKNRIITINNNLFNSYGKYDLMDALERIIEKGLYFKGSNLDKDSYGQIKRVINQYCEEKEKILRLTDDIFTKNISSIRGNKLQNIN
ncbi:MAG: hypothetical protein J6J17_04265 [Bacilli bacterium]|nr:hypothetical protein [Bacilli bacterium]